MPEGNNATDAPEEEPTYVATFDPDAGERASVAVVSAVAALVDEDPIELPPLYDVVDPDALESFVAHGRTTDAGSHQVWFTYQGFDVGVETDGRIRLEPATRTSDAAK